ncbi:hypothetical protein MJO28_009917 [Puccinia striiformis f. sp. tritici]|uniref:Uncharacterized protein n=1 Tax=Puccinia striiformis f. sp. tritici TaxID=168172 RepID=A0ACC0EBQ3_9BASI|nr:hypothetical protein MJO28_009917 [Puccinia striiformis f. sp. tritici]
MNPHVVHATHYSMALVTDGHTMTKLGEEFEPIITDLVQSGNSNQQILDHLKDIYSISISE